jgi:hypothetical protein
MRRASFDDPERVSKNLLRDSGLLFLPEPNHRQWRHRKE